MLSLKREIIAGSKIPLVPEVLLRLFLELNPIDSLRIIAKQARSLLEKALGEVIF